MSQTETLKAEGAEERTEETRSFVRRVRTATRRKYTPCPSAGFFRDMPSRSSSSHAASRLSFTLGCGGTAALHFACSFPWDAAAGAARDSWPPTGPPPLGSCVRAFLLSGTLPPATDLLPRTANGQLQPVAQPPAVAGADCAQGSAVLGDRQGDGDLTVAVRPDRDQPA